MKNYSFGQKNALTDPMSAPEFEMETKVVLSAGVHQLAKNTFTDEDKHPLHMPIITLTTIRAV